MRAFGRSGTTPHIHALRLPQRIDLVSLRQAGGLTFSSSSQNWDLLAALCIGIRNFLRPGAILAGGGEIDADQDGHISIVCYGNELK